MDEFVFHKLDEKGKGLPFGITSSKEELFKNREILSPSLRDFHVIFWFKKGYGNYFIDFKKYEFKPNTVVLVRQAWPPPTPNFLPPT